MTDRQSTHAPGCWDWGPRHYECAVGQIERDEALLRQALEPWANEPDVDAATMLRLIKTIKYLVGIAERGEGRKIADDETPEQFVLGYVKRLEQTNPDARAALRERLGEGANHD